MNPIIPAFGASSTLNYNGLVLGSIIMLMVASVLIYSAYPAIRAYRTGDFSKFGPGVLSPKMCVTVAPAIGIGLAIGAYFLTNLVNSEPTLFLICLAIAVLAIILLMGIIKLVQMMSKR